MYPPRFEGVAHSRGVALFLAAYDYGHQHAWHVLEWLMDSFGKVRSTIFPISVISRLMFLSRYEDYIIKQICETILTITILNCFWCCCNRW